MSEGEVYHQQKYALSEAQMGIWLGQKLNPCGSMYNAGEITHIRGMLDRDRFKQALVLAVSEADGLHMVFRETESGVFQYPTATEWELLYEDFSDQEQAADHAMTRMRSLVQQVVNLTTGPLFTQLLIKTEHDHFLWYQQIHHIVCDGYAFSLLNQRTVEIYNLLSSPGDNVAGDKLFIGKPFASYFPVIEEDRLYRFSEQYHKDREFWKSDLDGMRYPVSFSESLASVNNNAISKHVLISPKMMQEIKQLCLSKSVNWSNYFLALVVYLLFRHRAVNEVTIGIPVMCRMGSVSLRVPAMVMNIIPLRICLKPCHTFLDLLLLLSEKMRLVSQHQKYRYEHLRRDIHAVGGDKRLFGPVVNIMPFDSSRAFSGTHIYKDTLSAGPVEDISFNFIVNTDASLRFDIDANPDRYSIKDVEGFQSEIVDLMGSLKSDPQQPLQLRLDTLSWIQTDHCHNHQLQSVHELLIRQVQETPEATAVIDGDRSISYAELYEKSIFVAQSLYECNVGVVDLVALQMRRGEDAIVANIALVILGASYVFINPDGPETRNQMILDDAQPSLLIIDEASQHHTVEGFTTIRFSELCTMHHQNSACPIHNVADLPAYLIYTSGSTGKPKGVMISHRALAEFISSAGNEYRINKQDRVLQFAPLHFDTSVEEIFISLCSGATLIVRSEDMLDSLQGFLKTCEQWEISVLDLPTAYWHELVYYCANTGSSMPASVHTVIVGGEAVQLERLQQWHHINDQSIRLLNTYGPSEATVVATYADLSEDCKLSIGKPLPGRQVVVINTRGDIVPRGEEGELLLMGSGLANGYLNAENKDKARFQDKSFVFLDAPRRVYHTGDRVRINQQGSIEYLGRLDDEVKISGHRINPLEVEAAILAIDQVQEAAVVLHIQSSGEKYLAAYIVTDTDMDVKSLRNRLSKYLPPAMLPTSLVKMKQLPKNQAGKLDRRQLSMKKNVDVASSSTATDEETLIIDIWKQVLGQSEISPQDDFFLLGGQSLQTIQVANRLTGLLKRDIPITLLFQYPTVAELANALSKQSNNFSHDQLRQQIAEDCHLPESWLPHVDQFAGKEDEHRAMKLVLLTGATGFVGTQLLYQLLVNTEAQVICLARSVAGTEPMTRIKNAMQSQGLPYSEYEDRIEVFAADMEAPALGLATEQISYLQNHIDAIWHNAANTSVMRNYQSMKAANVSATRELLKIAAKRIVPFHFVSTISVAAPASIASELKEEYLPWHSALADGYQQSKWASENLLQVAAERGYPVNVYRLSRVSGHSENGYFNSKDLVWNILRASLVNRVFPTLDIMEPWTPVDSVTQAMVNISLKSELNGVFNLTPETLISLNEMFIWLMEYGYELQALNMDQWLQCLQNSPINEDQALLAFFKQREGSVHEIDIAPVNNQRFKLFLEQEGMRLPKVDQQIFNRYVQFAINSGHIVGAKNSTPEGGLCEKS
ncbi:MAG: amino acid adenylation domain-containing protein [Gammaproteobacteria bacterium]